MPTLLPASVSTHCPLSVRLPHTPDLSPQGKYFQVFLYYWVSQPWHQCRWSLKNSFLNGCPKYPRLCSSKPGLYPFDANSTPPPLWGHQKYLWTLTYIHRGEWKNKVNQVQERITVLAVEIIYTSFPIMVLGARCSHTKGNS